MISRKLLLLYYIIFLFFADNSFTQTKSDSVRDFNKPKDVSFSAVVKISNPLNKPLNNLLISIPYEHFKKKFPSFNEKSFCVFDGKQEIPSQLEDIDGNLIMDNILFLVSLKKNQHKSFRIVNCKSDKTKFIKQTHAEISIKTDYILQDGYYTGGQFKNVSEVEIPKNHFAHDALYKFEGPGWESENIGYRFYLDSRNRTDIWGKKVNDLVLINVGNKDLVSDSKESYTKMSEWGMDIFKVGESLGIGSIATWYDGKVKTVSTVDNTICKITADGIIKSNVLTKYRNWKVGSLYYDLTSLISISAGSRFSKQEIDVTGNLENICTGFAKHADCKFDEDNKNLEWGYLASYGKQSLAGDDLGLAIIYRKKDLIKITEDQLNHIVLLKPTAGKVIYYFGAAWEGEPNGIKSEKEFINYLNDVITEKSISVKTYF